MDTTTIKERELQEEALFEDDDTQEEQEPGMTDEELKIESLKIATNIGKLMNNVTTEDIVNIAETVAKFIKGGDSTSLETVESDEDFDTDEDTESDEESTDSEENFETEESDKETSEESDENKEENFEV